MKKLLQNDLERAGYELPTSGLCYNLDANDSKALISEGEWFLSEDELIAREGEHQQYLYMVVSGTVELSKSDPKGKKQKIADLGRGETFGEVAFLRGQIASATSQTRGTCILWRMDHGQLLEFIVSHGTIAGQVSLNLAGLLADRLLKENSVVSQVRMDLDEAITSLREAYDEDSVKTNALRELQSKVENLNLASRVHTVKEERKSPFNALATSSLALACLAFAGMFGLYKSYDHEAPSRVIALSKELLELKNDEAFYLDLKQRLELENQELAESNRRIKSLKKDTETKLLAAEEALSLRDNEYDALKSELIVAQDELAKLIELEKPAVAEEVIAEIEPADLYIPLIPQDFIEEIKDWTHAYSTLAFPCEVEVVKKPVVLSDLTLSANMTAEVGETLVVTRFHPVSEEYVVARRGDNDTFMASVHLDNVTIIEELARKYVLHMRRMGKVVSNPFIDNRFSQIDQNISDR